LDYKFLKKIINSLEKGRLGDAALFATGVRPSDSSQGAESLLGNESPASELQVHKAAFFFKLERDLEKINAFYLQKESDLRARLTTLIAKKRALIQAASRARKAGIQNGGISADSPSFVALLEGFRYFEKDLSKLQVRAAARLAILTRSNSSRSTPRASARSSRSGTSAPSRRPRSSTSRARWKCSVRTPRAPRAADRPACFNRAFITEMSDIAAASILQLESLAAGHELPATTYRNEAAVLGVPLTATNLPGSVLLHDQLEGEDSDAPLFASEQPLDFDGGMPHKSDTLAQLEERLLGAVRSGEVDDAVQLVREARKEEQQSVREALGPEAADAARSDNAPTSSGVSRLVWRALVDVPADAVHAAIAAGLPDYQFEDDINARTCLHLSAIAGHLELVRACVDHGVDVRRRDVYGREALAYAALHGHAEICRYLLSLLPAEAAAAVNAADQDGFSPLVQAVYHAHTETVRTLLDFAGDQQGDKTAGASDLVPLAIACQSGYVDITRLLLERGAKIESNAEGLMPQALAARAGRTECLRLLIEQHVDVNVTEKGTHWTPLFYAAENGCLECVRVLLEAGANAELIDEKQRHALFYAAWNGWMDCVQLLLSAPRAHRAADLAVEAGADPSAPSTGSSLKPLTDTPGTPVEDGIPSLYLPPPIIPFRTYGHNYLDKRSLLCLALTNKSVVLHKHPVPDRLDMFPGLNSTLKLVLTPRTSQVGAEAGIPHTAILPLAEEREEVTFQIEDPDTFRLECELFPTFGSSRIAKTALLPGVLSRVANRTSLELPLFDWHLNVVGHVVLELECVRPFESVQLEIGGRVETYWKSTLPGDANAGNPSGARRQTGMGADSGGMPAVDPPVAPAAAPVASEPSSYVTASSLSGPYLRLVVQSTRDAVPVVWAHPTLPGDVYQPPVAQVTAVEFNTIAERTGRSWRVSPEERDLLTLADWRAKLDECPVPLETLLATTPQSVSLALEIQDNTHLPTPLPVNECVDAILHIVYAMAERNREHSRSMFFSSSCPSVCVSLNWKQPNYAVFLMCQASLSQPARALDPRQASLKEAVRFAKNNNLLGVMVDGTLLEQVPELIPTIKAAGLVLITLNRLSGHKWPSHIPLPPHGSAAGLGPAALTQDDEAFDGYLQEGIIQYKSS